LAGVEEAADSCLRFFDSTAGFGFCFACSFDGVFFGGDGDGEA
jgi:hypothetical protein